MFITQLITLHSISDIVSSNVYIVLYSYPRAMGTFTAIEHLATFSLAIFAGQEIAPITVITNAVIVTTFSYFVQFAYIVDILVLTGFILNLPLRRKLKFTEPYNAEEPPASQN